MSTAAEHYEEKFEFPLFKLIKQYAQEHDVSYSLAADIVMPGYERAAGIRYRDREYELSEIHKREAEQQRLSAQIAERNRLSGKETIYDGLFATQFNAKFDSEER